MWPIGDLLPHSGEMILLDAVKAFEGDRITCTRQLTTPPRILQQADGSMPAWAGVELMAQAIAAWAGAQARQEQRAVRLGFLLGTRHYRSNVAVFPAGCTLQVSAERGFHDASGMGAFACRIEAPGVLVQARLTVFSPADASALLLDGAPKEVSA